MSLGRKTGGRKPGTPNKKTKELEQVIKMKHPTFDPVLEMIDLYNHPDTDIPTKKDLLKSISPYLYPKRRSVSSDQETKMLVEINKAKFSRGQLLALLPPGIDPKWAESCNNERLQQVIAESISDKVKTQFMEIFNR